MNKETLKTLQEAVFYTEDAIEMIKREEDHKFKARYLEILDKALTDLEFIKSHYDFALAVEENPDKADKILYP